MRQTWNDYVSIRRAYREGKATTQELAHALTLVNIANAKADMTQTDIEA